MYNLDQNSNYLQNSKIIDKNVSYNKKTFSGYKKTSVFTELNNCLLDNRVENVCYWGAEILCSGFINLLWEKIIIFSSKYININNPLLPKYLYEKYKEYEIIKKKCQTKNFIELRNNIDFRKQLCEILVIISLSKKINIPKIPKIYSSDFDIINIQNKLQAKNTDNVNKIFKKNDPLELRIPINELMYNIKNKNLNNSVYWLSWIIEYDKKISKKEKSLLCNTRNIDKIEDKYKTDVSWLIWNSIFFCCRDSIYIEQIKYLYQIYKINFTKSKKNSRISLFVHSILLIIEKIDNNIPLKNREDIIVTAVNNINVIYKRLQDTKIQDSYKINISNEKESLEKTEKENEKEKEKKKLAEKILKENKKKKNNISDESQQKLDIIMNMTNIICR